MEFLEIEAVQNAVLLSESELHHRPLKVLNLFLSGVTYLFFMVIIDNCVFSFS